MNWKDPEQLRTYKREWMRAKRGTRISPEGKILNRCGTRNGRAKLTPKRVAAIRKSQQPERVLAAKNQVAPSTIHAIKAREIWTEER